MSSVAKSDVWDSGLGILEITEEPVLIFSDAQIVFANRNAVRLFGYESTSDMNGLMLSDITSEYEKKKDYFLRRSHDFMRSLDVIDSSRFRWIHRKKDGENFYSEVISVQLPEIISVQWNHCDCVIIKDMSHWRELKVKSESYYESAANPIDSVEEAVLIIDPETGRIIDANRQACEFYGYSLVELRAKSIQDINTLGASEVKAEMEKARAEKRGHFLFKHKMASGETVDVNVLSGPVKYLGRTALYSIVTTVSRGVRHLPASLEEPVERDGKTIYESLFHNIQLPIAIFKPDMRVGSVNAAFLSEFGYTMEEVINQHITPLICPWEYVEEAEFYHDLVLHGNNIFEEVSRRSRSGTLKRYRVNAFSLVSSDIISDVVAVYFDVDAEQKARVKLHLMNKVFENIEEGMMITDAKASIIWVNQAFQAITGYGFSQVIGCTPKMMRSDAHDDIFYMMLRHSLDSDGYWEGEVCNRRQNGDTYQAWLTIISVKDKGDKVTNYIGVIKDISKFKAQEERIQQLARTDMLTGLLNRNAFLENAQGELAKTPHGIRHAVLFIDMDGFKKINDMYGHDQGDRLLKVLAYRLKSAVSGNDMVGRIGGDEFVVLLRDIELESVAGIAKRLVQVVERSMSIHGQKIRMEVSIGVSIYPDDDVKLQDLLKQADIALYQAKKHSGSHIEFYSKEIEELFSQMNQLEQQLKNALENDEFDIAYQGIVGKDGLEFCSAEALLRWNNEVLERVSPELFIPVAERIGLMPEIGLWVIDRVLQDMKKWSFDKRLPDGVAINISVTQLEGDHFVRNVKSLFEKHDVAPEKVEFEITETVNIGNFEQVVEVIGALHEYGIRFAMDDFGTGYSSLSTIHELQLSKLKIDGAFIRRLPEQKKSVELTQSIISMARSLRLKVVAECVENSAQVDFLKENNCDYMQGYAFSRPTSGSEFAAHLRRIF